MTERTWRWFCVRLDGLSAESWWWRARTAASRTNGDGGRGMAPKPDVVLTDPADIEAFAAGLSKRH